MRTWYTAQAADGVAEVAIYSDIGAWGISAMDFLHELRSFGQVSQINVLIDSNGGFVDDAIAIYNMLKRHPAKVTVKVDALAASAATLIAMAGDDVQMPENTAMFLHNPAAPMMGFYTAEQLTQEAADAGVTRERMLRTYAAKSTLSSEEIGAILDASTYLTANEAVAMGFADTVLPLSTARATAKVDQLPKAPPKVIAARLAGSAPRAAYDPDGDGDDDVLEAIGFIGYAIDNLADAVGALTGTGEEEGAGDKLAAPAMAAIRKAMRASFKIGKMVADPKRSLNPTAVAELGNANAGGAPGKDADPPKAQAEDKPAPTGIIIGAEVVTDRTDEILQICASCELAGFPEMSSQFMRSGKSLSQVQAELRALRADRGRGASYGGDDVSARHAVEDIDAAASRRGWDKAVNRLNARLAE